MPPHPLSLPKFSYFLKTAIFYYGNGYFDNDNGQTLFLNGIVMDIMVENVEITEYPSLSGRLAFFTP